MSREHTEMQVFWGCAKLIRWYESVIISILFKKIYVVHSLVLETRVCGCV